MAKQLIPEELDVLIQEYLTDSDEDEEEWERFDEMKFHVIRYDDSPIRPAKLSASASA
jgi:hypothetical protein